MSEESMISEVLTPEPKLFAGKFKSVEDLEEGYKQSAKVFNENRELQNKLKNYTEVPEDYVVPENLSLRDVDIREIKRIAKNTGLTQWHFEKMATEMESRIKDSLNDFEKTKQAIPTETLTVIEEYVNTSYPESLRKTVLNQIIKDKDAMSDAMKHRDALLNSSVPGLNHSNQGNKSLYDGEAEVQKAAELYKSQPNERNLHKYINTAREVGHERFPERK